jgi:folate-dependent phosphoribosylglycinamide formyltransferase PurN
MRIVFLAVDDEFAGVMQEELFRTHPEWVVGSVLSKNSIFKKNLVQAAIFIISTSGIAFFLEMFRMKILRKLTGGSKKPSPRSLARQHSIPIFQSGNINDAASLAQLKAWNPDLVISTNFSHYIGKKARGVAKFGTWNLHKALLPEYRGMAPSFHALREGKDQVGVTLHVVEKGFDTGDILTQKAIPIGSDDTVYSLNCCASAEGGKLMSEYLAQLDLDAFLATPQPEGDWDNYTYPTPGEVRQFKKQGLKF